MEDQLFIEAPARLQDLAPSAITIMALNSAGGVLKRYADFRDNKWIPLILVCLGVPLFMGVSESWTWISGIYGFIHSVGAVGLYETFKATKGPA